MPRQMRQRSRTGIYHVMTRGNGGQSLFENEDDNRKFLEILYETKEKLEHEIDLYAYCLMGNHIHLLIKENNVEIGNFMRRSMAQYAQFVNWKYQRKGHVFQDRYKSEPVEDDKYLLTVFRYILQNPVKAGLSKSVFDYRWNSWKAYGTGQEYPIGLTDTAYVTSLFHSEPQKAIEKMKVFLEEPGTSTCLDVDTVTRLTDDEVRQKIMQQFPEIKYQSLQQVSKERRKESLRNIKSIEGASLRQIARITGIGIKIVQNA